MDVRAAAANKELRSRGKFMRVGNCRCRVADFNLPPLWPLSISKMTFALRAAFLELFAKRCSRWSGKILAKARRCDGVDRHPRLSKKAGNDVGLLSFTNLEIFRAKTGDQHRCNRTISGRMRSFAVLRSYRRIRAECSWLHPR